MPNPVQRERARRRRSAASETTGGSRTALASPVKPTLIQRVRYSFDLALARSAHSARRFWEPLERCVLDYEVQSPTSCRGRTGVGPALPQLDDAVVDRALEE